MSISLTVTRRFGNVSSNGFTSQFALAQSTSSLCSHVRDRSYLYTNAQQTTALAYNVLMHLTTLENFDNTLTTIIRYNKPNLLLLKIQELSYRQQIARQLRTQYAEGIYRHTYYTVTLKYRLRVT